jgi:hypothetical protein
MSALENGRAPGPPLGAEVLCYETAAPNILFAGSAMGTFGGRVKVRIKWVSDGRPLLVGQTKDFDLGGVLPPAAIIPTLSKVDAQTAVGQLHRERSQNAVKLVGFWQAFQAHSKAEAISEMASVLEIDNVELSRAVFTALIAADADKNGVVPALTLEGTSVDVHDEQEHEQYGGCRFCNSTVAATYRASMGEVEGIKARPGAADEP